MGARFAEVKSFKASISIEGGPARPREGTLEAILPDKFQLTLPGAELIIIGDDQYLKLFGGAWGKSKAPAVSGNVFDPRQVTDLMGATFTGFVKRETDTVNGKPCQTYVEAIKGAEICIASNLPVRIVFQGSGTRSTVTFVEFDPAVEIVPPIGP